MLSHYKYSMDVCKSTGLNSVGEALLWALREANRAVFALTQAATTALTSLQSQNVCFCIFIILQYSPSARFLKSLLCLQMSDLRAYCHAPHGSVSFPVSVCNSHLGSFLYPSECVALAGKAASKTGLEGGDASPSANPFEAFVKLYHKGFPAPVKKDRLALTILHNSLYIPGIRTVQIRFLLC
jgi:hypothetical protein